MRQYATAGLIALLLTTAAVPRGAARGADEPARDLPAFLNATSIKEAAKDDTLRKLLKERYNESLAEAQDRFMSLKSGKDAGAGAALEALKRFMQAGLELQDSRAGRVALLEKYADATNEVEKLVQSRIDAGFKGYGKADLHQAKSFRADAEIQLLRAKEALKKKLDEKK